MDKKLKEKINNYVLGGFPSDKEIELGLEKAIEEVTYPDWSWEKFRKTPKSKLDEYHFGLGLYIRNNFYKNVTGKHRWMDDAASGIILEEWHNILNRKKKNKAAKCPKQSKK